MSRWKDNWQWKLISLLIGVLLWSFVIAEVNPSQTTTIRGVQVDVRNATELDSQNLKITHMEPSSVSFNVSGTRNSLGNASFQNYQAYIDVATLQEGASSVPIRYELPSGVSLEDTVTENVNVVVEKVITKDLPITVQMAGNLAENYILEATTPTPSQVSVVGARSQVEKIQSLTAVVSGEGVQQDTTVNVPIRALDQEGTEVSGVTLGQGFVNVAISVMKTKEVSIEVQTQNEPANDVQIKSTRVVPDTILIKGKAAAVDAVKSVQTEVIDLSQIRADGERTVALEMPAGVVAVDSTRETQVVIDVDLQENKVIEVPIDQIQLPEAPEGRSFHIETAMEVVTVTVRGFADDLVNATPDNVKVSLTLESDLAGTRRGELQATVPDNVTLVSVSPTSLPVLVESVEANAGNSTEVTPGN